jgi:hypothetical protein
VASVGRGWPQGIRSSLGDYGWPCVFADGLVGSWVPMGGRGWPLGVAVDLGRLQVTIVTCQSFTNVPNFRLKRQSCVLCLRLAENDGYP